MHFNCLLVVFHNLVCSSSYFIVIASSKSPTEKYCFSNPWKYWERNLGKQARKSSHSVDFEMNFGYLLHVLLQWLLPVEKLLDIPHILSSEAQTAAVEGTCSFHFSLSQRRSVIDDIIIICTKFNPIAMPYTHFCDRWYVKMLLLQERLFSRALRKQFL